MRSQSRLAPTQVSLSIPRHNYSFTRRDSVRGMRHFLPDPSALGKEDRPGHVSVPSYMAALRQPVRHVSVPRSVYFHPRTRPSAPDPVSDVSDPGGDRPVCGTTHATDTDLSAAPGGGPFSRTPEAETYVFSPQQAPVPPPPASSCEVSRGWHGDDSLTGFDSGDGW